jgi:hypothetical protein
MAKYKHDWKREHQGLGRSFGLLGLLTPWPPRLGKSVRTEYIETDMGYRTVLAAI